MAAADTQKSAAAVDAEGSRRQTVAAATHPATFSPFRAPCSRRASRRRSAVPMETELKKSDEEGDGGPVACRLACFEP